MIAVRERKCHSPRSVEARPVLVAPPERVRPRKRDNLLIVETHPVKDVPQVVLILVAIGEAAVGSAVFGKTVLASRTPGYLGTSHLLYRADAGEGPEVRVGQACQKSEG